VFSIKIILRQLVNIHALIHFCERTLKHKSTK
jgi:hypothetical protein